MTSAQRAAVMSDKHARRTLRRKGEREAGARLLLLVSAFVVSDTAFAVTNITLHFRPLLLCVCGGGETERQKQNNTFAHKAQSRIFRSWRLE